MKKFRPFILLLSVVMLFSFTMPVSLAKETTTTIMLYMCGSDLQEYALDNLYTMASIDIPDSVNLVVWAGGADEWDDEDLEGEVINTFTVEYDTFNDLTVVDSENMGTAETLYDFMRYARDNYPADRYGLVLWDHGGGSAGGVCYDETYGDDMLSMAEINDALYAYVEEDKEGKLDFIGCDACLMATYEMAAHLMYYADYFVASQELEPGTGWGYDQWLTAFCEDPSMSTEELCKTIADGYYDTCEELDEDQYFTQSVIYLPAMENLKNQMEKFSTHLSAALENGELATISRLRSRMFDFGSFYDQSLDMVDMAQLVSAYRDFAPKTANNVLSALEDAVIYTRNGDSVSTACGLSILMPLNIIDSFDEYMEGYNACGYIDNYEKFITEYAYQVAGSDYIFSSSTPYAMGSDDLSDESFLDLILDLIFPESEYVSDESDVLEEYTPENDWSFSLADLVQPSVDFDPENTYAYSMQLTKDEMENLNYVEGMLMMDIGEGEGYIDLGYLRNAFIDWQNGTIYSMFDGTWPLLNGQPVAIYEQTANQVSRRALIPVRVNGEECYMIVVFDENHPDGRIIGYSEGYTEEGLPARGTNRFETGDEVIPVYTLYVPDEDGEMLEDTFDGDPIIVDEDGFDFEFVSLEDSDTTFLYCFCINDIFGDYQFSDFVEFEF